MGRVKEEMIFGNPVKTVAYGLTPTINLIGKFTPKEDETLVCGTVMKLNFETFELVKAAPEVTGESPVAAILGNCVVFADSKVYGLEANGVTVVVDGLIDANKVTQAALLDPTISRITLVGKKGA